MRVAWLVARTDLRRRLRNRSAIITAIVGPLAMAFVFSSLTAGTGFTFTIGIADDDRTALSASVVDEMTAEPAYEADGARAESPLRFARVTSASTARQLLDDGEIDAAIVIPAGFSTVADGASVRVEVLRNPRRRVSGQVAESIAQQVASRFDRVSLAARAATALDPATAVAAAVAAQQAPQVIVTSTDLDEGGDLTSSAFFGASMSMLFLSFTMAMGARSLLLEKSSGAVGRMMASGAPPAAILAGKTLSVAVLGFIGFGVVWGVTTLVFGASWGAPLAVILVITATVVAVAGVGTFVAGLARTERQVDGYTSTITFVFALLGGNFVGTADQPPLLRRLSLLTPNGWSLRAFSDVAADAATPGRLATAIAVLVVAGAAFGAVGSWRLTKVLSR